MRVGYGRNRCHLTQHDDLSSRYRAQNCQKP